MMKVINNSLLESLRSSSNQFSTNKSPKDSLSKRIQWLSTKLRARRVFRLERAAPIYPPSESLETQDSSLKIHPA
jgi:hypothetical protein